MADFDLDPRPESTWGASPAYIAAWNAKFGNGSGVSAPEVEKPAAPVEENLARPAAFEGLGERLSTDG